MSNVAKLKKKAAELEQKKQFDKALQIYVQILEEIRGKEEEGDVALYNRVGDLMLRQGNVGEAVNQYERAVDLYADGGFFNNAIALCNKILRHAPGRSSIYYKLGKISAQKGFKSDAKQNFLEYADRMQKAGQIDEAFRALKEFADLCPDQDDIRLMLAEQLSKKGRKGEALDQLQALYEKFEAEGRSAEARATVDRMKAIDPAVEPKAGEGTQPAQKSSELVFLEVNYDDEPKKKATGGRKTVPVRPPREEPPPAAPAPIDFSNAAPPPVGPPDVNDPFAGADLPGLQLGDAGPGQAPDATGGAGGGLDALGGAMLDIQPTSFDADAGANGAGMLMDFEPTAFGGSGLDGATLDDAPPARGSVHDLALPGELPMLDGPGSEPPDGGSIELILPDDSLPSVGGAEGLLGELDPPIAREADAGSMLAGDDVLEIHPGIEPLTFDIGGLGDDASPTEPPAESPLDSDVPLIEMEQSPAAAPPPARPSAAPAPAAPAAAGSASSGIDDLRARSTAEPTNWTLHRQLAESLLEHGEREEGLAELETAMIGFDRLNDLDSASSVADEIIRLNPNSVRHHQKRVEYAFRMSDKRRLAEAYLELADALFRSGQPDKAKAVYQRVLELAPDDLRAQAALSAFIEPAPTAPARKERGAVGAETGKYRRYTAELRRTPAPEPPAEAARASAMDDGDGSFVDLTEWLREEQGPKSTRMVVEEQAPTGDEQADFAEMLRRFKQGVAENVEDEDHQSHYDLGVAYKEMGLLDEAIAEFQKALRGSDSRVRTYEALGQCFLEKSQFQVAAGVLQRALGEPGLDDAQLVGVLYLMGYACEALQLWSEALGYYQRVFAVDIQFRDVSDRISALERAVP